MLHSIFNSSLHYNTLTVLVLKQTFQFYIYAAEKTWLIKFINRWSKERKLLATQDGSPLTLHQQFNQQFTWLYGIGHSPFLKIINTWYFFIMLYKIYWQYIDTTKKEGLAGRKIGKFGEHITFCPLPNASIYTNLS